MRSNSRVPTLAAARLTQHELGDSLFAVGFIDAATGMAPNVGLGPLFNNTSCFACHELNGRGQPPLVPRAFRGMLFRLSVPPLFAEDPPRPVPGFGGQLQNRAIVGTVAEGTVDITYERVSWTVRRRIDVRAAAAYLSAGRNVHGRLRLTCRSRHASPRKSSASACWKQFPMRRS